MCRVAMFTYAAEIFSRLAVVLVNAKIFVVNHYLGLLFALSKKKVT
jgi:hypothetical protein